MVGIGERDLLGQGAAAPGLAGRNAHSGRTVLVSSHLPAEMQLMVDHPIVIGRGTVLADDSVEGFLAKSLSSDVLVRFPDPPRCPSRG